MQDCGNANPVLRGTALKTLTRVTHPDLQEFSLKATLRSLQDSSAYVRRIGVLSCARLYSSGLHALTEHGVVDELYAMIRDNDVIVMLNCLRALDVILRQDGGVIINRKINNFIINRLDQVHDSHLPQVVTFLQRYKPRSESEVLELMNACDAHLSSFHAAVVVAVLQYFLFLCSGNPARSMQVLERSISSLMRHLNDDRPEMVYAVLTCIQKHYCSCQETRKLVTTHKSFFLRPNDPEYLSAKRLEVFVSLLNADNYEQLEQEFVRYFRARSSQLSCAAVDSVRIVLHLNPSLTSSLVEHLAKFLTPSHRHLHKSVICVISQVDLSNCSVDVIKGVLRRCCDVLKRGDVACSLEDLLWLFGQHGFQYEDVVYCFEDFTSSFDNWSNTSESSALVSTAVKLFLRCPTQTHHVLAVVLETAHTRGDRSTKQLVLHYYRMLQADVQFTKTVVL